MEQYVYLAALIFSIVGITILDWRYRLAWFWQWRSTFKLLGIGLLFFVAWDIAGIGLGIFWTNPQYVSGLYLITPNLPVEEFIFLYFLNYLTLCIWRLQWRTSS